MNVLGLHGVYPRSHDASACLIDEQGIKAFAEEERFVRSKKAFDLKPENAIGYCLDSTGQDINEIAALTYGWRGPLLRSADLLPQRFQDKRLHEIPVVQVGHHEAHAASVFYTSPFTDAAVIVIDGQGEHESSSIWHANERELRQRASYDVSTSLGYMYGAISNFCGLGSFGAGKIMGLAPYGEPKYMPTLIGIYQNLKLPRQAGYDSQDAYFQQFLGELYAKGFPEPTFYEDHDQVSGKPRIMPELKDIHRDMAASVQKLLEQEVMRLVRSAKDLTGAKYVCLAGGVAMNCVANSVIQDSGVFEDVFVQPGCEDCGVSLGSALAVMKQKIPLTSIYTGPSYDETEISRTLSELELVASRHDNIALKAAELLASNKIIGWFQGGLEYGPRALGGRSILANPSTTGMRDAVNQAKQRESWRPFGPSVLAERASDLFEHAHESKYMLRSFVVRDAWRDKLPAIVHVDGTTRPQTVNSADNPLFHDLISNFGRLTGLPAVLNTSFNNYDEPIVMSPLDAIKTFKATKLGALILGNYVLVQ